MIFCLKCAQVIVIIYYIRSIEKFLFDSNYSIAALENIIGIHCRLRKFATKLCTKYFLNNLIQKIGVTENFLKIIKITSKLFITPKKCCTVNFGPFNEHLDVLLQ